MNKKTLVRYLLVGLSAYIIEMLTLYTFKHGLGYSAVEAVTISFWVGLTFAFVMQKILAFQNYEKRIHIVGFQLLGYSILVLWNYFFTVLMVYLFSKYLGVYAVRTLVIGISTVWNYLVYVKLFK